MILNINFRNINDPLLDYVNLYEALAAYSTLIEQLPLSLLSPCFGMDLLFDTG